MKHMGFVLALSLALLVCMISLGAASDEPSVIISGPTLTAAISQSNVCEGENIWVDGTAAGQDVVYIWVCQKGPCTTNEYGAVICVISAETEAFCRIYEASVTYDEFSQLLPVDGTGTYTVFVLSKGRDGTSSAVDKYAPYCFPYGTGCSKLISLLEDEATKAGSDDLYKVLTYTVMECSSVSKQYVVAATASRVDADTVRVSYMGGSDANQLSSMSISLSGAGTGGNCGGATGSLGNTVGGTTTIDCNGATATDRIHVIATAKFYDGSTQVILETDLESTYTATPTLTPTQTATPTLTPTPTPTPTPVPTLKSLTVSIEPKTATVKPGETINYTITADWSPETWSGVIDASIKVEAFGFAKEYQHSFDTTGATPPFEHTIPLTLPENVPPSTYKAILSASAEGITSSSETALTASMPGFEAILAIVGLLVVGYFMRRG